MDPLAEHQNQIDKSPYAYAWNNPIYYTDPDGMCPTCKDGEEAKEIYTQGAIVENKDGKWQFDNGNWIDLKSDYLNFSSEGQRYGYNGTLDQYRQQYGVIGTYDQILSQWESNYGDAFRAWTAQMDKEERDQIVLQKLSFFVQGFVTSGVMGMGALAGGHQINAKQYNYIKRFSHQSSRALQRGITQNEINDALNNPLQIKPIKYDEFGRASQVLVGRYATVVRNPNTGKTITSWKTGAKTLKKLTE